ncbi:MAG: MBL fold metallo-hydrolase [Actinobacteria bacterium]|nr:MBL fold metallo-hydrolase [Actinomycetota bacterium]
MPDVAVTPLGHDLYLIDALMHDQPERLACYLFDTPERVLVECGPSSSIAHLFAALDHLGIDDIGTLAVTHIHLDHAGGAGHFAARFPQARVAVHTRGAPHLVDPARLLASATRIYGEEGMRRYWGPMEPLDPARLVVLDEGDRLRLGGSRALEVLYTPGHAKHHLVYLEAETGACLVGDEIGVAFPHGHAVQPDTPPPDFDPVLITEQLHRIAARRPAFLGLAHFGLHPDPQAALAQAEQRLWEAVAWIEGTAPAEDEAAAYRSWALAGLRALGLPEEEIAKYDDSTFWDMQPAGLRRWLERRPSP